MLDGGSAVRLSLSVFGDQIVSAVARDTLLHKASVKFDEQRVMDAARQMVAALARGNKQRKLTETNLNDLRTIGEELYRALIPEATREDLAEVEGRSLLLELDESLVAVPWELLSDGKKFLCRRFDVGRAVFTPQPRRAQGARRMGRPARMLVLCSDPRNDLAAVADEGQAIVDALDAHPSVVVRMASGKGLDFVRKGIKDYDIVHYAGHADYEQRDPQASGWHLTDGKLTARDIAELAGGRPMPLLVFSNACQSSQEENWRASDPGRVFGLANAFLLSGVKYYIGTQWEIVDAQSQVFAQAFYTELGRGRPIGAAVRRAREAVIVAEGEGALGWAGYVLYGDPSYAPLAAEEGARPPSMPTPADIQARESIKGVVKKISRPQVTRSPSKVSGEINTPAPGSTPSVIIDQASGRTRLRPEPSIPLLWWVCGVGAIVVAIAVAVVILRHS